MWYYIGCDGGKFAFECLKWPLGAQKEGKPMKKTYRKPELKTRKIELGVFGEYGQTDRRVDPSPVDVINDLSFRME